MSNSRILFSLKDSIKLNHFQKVGIDASSGLTEYVYKEGTLDQVCILVHKKPETVRDYDELARAFDQTETYYGQPVYVDVKGEAEMRFYRNLVNDVAIAVQASETNQSKHRVKISSSDVVEWYLAQAKNVLTTIEEDESPNLSASIATTSSSSEYSSSPDLEQETLTIRRYS